jgi:hypothetical protein
MNTGIVVGVVIFCTYCILYAVMPSRRKNKLTSRRRFFSQWHAWHGSCIGHSALPSSSGGLSSESEDKVGPALNAASKRTT